MNLDTTMESAAEQQWPSESFALEDTQVKVARKRARERESRTVTCVDINGEDSDEALAKCQLETIPT